MSERTLTRRGLFGFVASALATTTLAEKAPAVQNTVTVTLELDEHECAIAKAVCRYYVPNEVRRSVLQ